MQLSFQSPGEVLHVRQMSDAGIQVGETLLTRSFLLSAEVLEQDWGVADPAELTVEVAQALLQRKPDVILIGTGERLVFPDQRFLYEGLSRGVGIEVMDNAAACRTFNVLVAEDRRVLMGVIL